VTTRATKKNPISLEAAPITCLMLSLRVFMLSSLVDPHGDAAILVDHLIVASKLEVVHLRRSRRG
jgi:hypothetical protein